jgi:beta-galactosidase
LTIQIDRAGFVLPTGDRLPALSGTIHYWRLERALWPAILESVCELGFRMIETYVPWNVHEVDEGCYDWGEKDPAKNLDAFLTCAESMGLHVVLRPGPHFNAELNGFGFPRRVLLNPAVQARTADGTTALFPYMIEPFPVPSYASEAFCAKVSGWLDAAFGIMNRHLYPNGCVVALQVDNEIGYFFRTPVFDLDYAPDSIALYRRWLESRYGDVADLNHVYGTAYEAFAEVQPPRRFAAQHFSDLPFFADWAAYREYYLVAALSRLAAMFRERWSEPVPLFHNFSGVPPVTSAMPYGTPYHIPAVEQTIEVCGVDMYLDRESYTLLKRQVQCVVGTSRLPSVPEFGSGVWPWIRPLLPQDESFTLPSLFMHGIKWANLYMLVERDRWTGSPITSSNRKRSEYCECFEQWNDLLESVDITSFDKDTPVALLTHRDCDRVAAASALFVPPTRLFLAPNDPEMYLNEDSFGLSHPVALAYHRQWEAWYEDLTQGGYSFDLPDSECSIERFNQYRALALPCYEFLSRPVQERLAAYVRGGGILLIGPMLPHLDERMQPCEILADVAGDPGKGSLVTIPEGQTLSNALAGQGVLPLAYADDPCVELTVHRRGEQILVYASNPTPEEREAVLTLREHPDATWQELWPHRVRGDSGSRARLAPYSIRVWEVSVYA